jgi:FkbM family methyltransferase
MKKIIRKILNGMGFEIHRKRNPVVIPAAPAKVKEDTMEAGMLRAKNKFGVNPKTVIDLGAAAGTWTLKAEKVWPAAEFILFEPLEERKAELNALAEKNPKIKPVFAAAGNKKGKVKFRVTDDLDGSGVYDAEKDGNGRDVTITTIDDEVQQPGARSPFVIKFDTHGFEVPILQGASKTLADTQLVIMECYGFRIAENSLLFPEMCAHMEKLGFRLADVVDSMRREGDQLFWQCDVFFLPLSHPAFLRNTYKE